jgi:hypothetical protein
VHGLRLPGSRDDGSDYFVWRKLLTVLKRFGSTATNKWVTALSRGYSMEEIRMKKTLALVAVSALAATSVAAPAPAEARGIGPGLAFGLAAGALAAGAAGAYGPYYCGPGYGYYGPRYYGPAYYGGPYASYGGPYYRHRYWRRHW